jgi:hypothetical protein
VMQLFQILLHTLGGFLCVHCISALTLELGIFQP